MDSVLIHLWMPYIAQIRLGAAFDANRKAEAVWLQLSNMPKQVETYEIRQFLYQLADEPENQLATLSELRRLSLSTDNQMSQGNALGMIADVHRLQGYFAEELASLKKALAVIKFREHPIWK
jgi:hypothetical protein